MSNRDDLALPRPERQEVIVTDINMPFASMVGFMVKWAFASIPAMIIIAFLGFLLAMGGGVLMGVIAGIGAGLAS